MEALKINEGFVMVRSFRRCGGDGMLHQASVHPLMPVYAH